MLFLKILLIILIVVIVFVVFSYIFASSILNKSFTRMGEDQATMFIKYDEIKDKYERSEYEFKSKKNTLKGYLYKSDSKDDLIIYVHGLCAGHQGYLSDITALVDKGYNVFTYDFTATGASSGKRFCGLNQQLYDLRNAIKFLKSQKLFSYNNIYLYGHSMGGYAVACIDDEIVSSIVSISGFDSHIDELLSVFCANKSKFFKLFANTVVRIKYFFDLGFKYDYKAHKNLQSTNTRTLIIHGNNDELVKFDTVSIISKKDLINNDKVSYLEITDPMHNSHNSIIASNECVLYQKQITEIFDKAIEEKKTRKEALEISTQNLDRFKFNQANQDMIDLVDKFYKEK